MKTKVLVILLAICSIGLFTGCTIVGEKPSKTIITRHYNVGNFNAIESGAMGNVEFVQSTDGKCTVSIKGPENYIKKYFTVKVENNTLYIRCKEENHIFKAHIDIKISAPTLTNIESKGVGNFHISNIAVKNLEIYNKGVGNINIDSISGSSLSVNTKGVGNISIKGKVHVASLACSGVGDIKADELESKVVDATCRGVGSITCFATDSMTAAARGVGSIKYKGKPAFKDLAASGVGSIKEY
jgi:hypothetical protein